MKRMDEVFEFPLDVEQRNYTAYMSDSNICFACFDNAISHGGDDLSRAQHVAHAINHVDALADALEALFQSYKALADSGDAGNWSVEDLDEGKKAIAALAVYRGEK